MPYCSDDKKHPGKNIRLLQGTAEDKLMYCPKCKRVYHPKGHAHMQPEPVWKLNKVDKVDEEE